MIVMWFWNGNGLSVGNTESTSFCALGGHSIAAGGTSRIPCLLLELIHGTRFATISPTTSGGRFKPLGTWLTIVAVQLRHRFGWTVLTSLVLTQELIGSGTTDARNRPLLFLFSFATALTETEFCPDLEHDGTHRKWLVHFQILRDFEFHLEQAHQRWVHFPREFPEWQTADFTQWLAIPHTILVQQLTPMRT